MVLDIVPFIFHCRTASQTSLREYFYSHQRHKLNNVPLLLQNLGLTTPQIICAVTLALGGLLDTGSSPSANVTFLCKELYISDLMLAYTSNIIGHLQINGIITLLQCFYEF